MTSKFMTIPELADKMGISRIAVYKRVKKAQIPAQRIGRIYAISEKDAADLIHATTAEMDGAWIDNAVRQVVSEYGILLKWLSQE